MSISGSDLPRQLMYNIVHWGSNSNSLYSESDVLQPFNPYTFIIWKVSSQFVSSSKIIEEKREGVSTPLQKNLKKEACRVKEVRRVFSLIDMEYFEDGQRLPFYLRKNACTGGVNDRMICQKYHSLSIGKSCLYPWPKYLRYFLPIGSSGW